MNNSYDEMLSSDDTKLRSTILMLVFGKEFCKNINNILISIAIL
jgi:hypothetical protein